MIDFMPAIWHHLDLSTPLGASVFACLTMCFFATGWVPFNVMKVKGRWSSDAFTLYLRKHAKILAPYIQVVPVIHDTFARLTMPAI